MAGDMELFSFKLLFLLFIGWLSIVWLVIHFCGILFKKTKQAKHGLVMKRSGREEKILLLVLHWNVPWPSGNQKHSIHATGQ